MSDNALKKIETTIAPLVAEARELKVANDEDLKDATTLLSKMNTIIDNVEAEKDKVLSPLKQAMKAEQDRWKPIELMYKGPIEYVRSVISAYQTAKTKAAKLEEAKIASRMGEGRGKLSLETAVKKMGEIDQPEKKVETVHGSITFRTDEVLKVVDPSKVPQKYFKLDEKAVLDALKAGVVVPGAELEEVQVPINRRS
jgi:hypothetical protein